jgi:hypothetical protein
MQTTTRNTTGGVILTIQRPTPPGAHKFPADKQEFNTKDAAEYIGRKPETIRYHHHEGNLKPCGSYGGALNNLYYLYCRDDLDDLYYRHCYEK